MSLGACEQEKKYWENLSEGPMTVDLVPCTLEFMEWLCPRRKARNCVCWPF